MDPIIHKTAEVSPQARVGQGTRIWHNCQVLAGAVVGKNCTIGHNCLIAADAKIGNGVKVESNTDIWGGVTLGDFVFVGPSAVFTNDMTARAKYPKRDFPQYGKWLPTLAKEGSSIGANATIVCGSVIGRWAFVGAGAVVKGNVPDYAIAVGVPAKVIGWVCECGNKLEFKKSKTACKICGRKYKKEKLKISKSVS